MKYTSYDQLKPWNIYTFVFSKGTVIMAYNGDSRYIARHIINARGKYLVSKCCQLSGNDYFREATLEERIKLLQKMPREEAIKYKKIILYEIY